MPLQEQTTSYCKHLPLTRLRTCWKRYFAVFMLLVLVLTVTLRFAPSTPTPSRENRVIGYACLSHCGGLADRQKGIVTAYVIAAMLRTRFKILMPSPCEVSFFLSPVHSDMDWRITPDVLVSKQVLLLGSLDSRGRKFVQEFLAMEDPLSELFTAEYNFLTLNLELVYLLKQHRWAKRLPWLRELSVPDVYRYVLSDLFDLMPGSRLQLQSFTNSLPPDVSLVCAQLRMGGGMDSEDFNTFEQLASLTRFLAPYNTTSHSLFVTSDNPSVVSHMENYFPSLIVQLQGGQVNHIDKIKGQSVCPSFQRALVEQQVLALCDVLIISESGFGKIAAFLRHTDKNLYLFHDGVVHPFWRNHSFPNRISW